MKLNQNMLRACIVVLIITSLFLSLLKNSTTLSQEYDFSESLCNSSSCYSVSM